MSRAALSTIIVVLALVDGLIHLFLARAFFHLSVSPKNILSVLFPLDFLGFVVLVILFILAARGAVGLRRTVDVVMIGYAAIEIIAWFSRNHPNPFGYLGYATKAIEVVLIVLLAAHLASLGTERSPGLAASARS